MSFADLPNDADEIEPTLAEFWKPSEVGETLVGILRSFSERTFDVTKGPQRSFTLTPALLFTKGGAVAVEHRSVSLNTWLDKLVRREQISRVLALEYTGKQDTKAGKMRTFTVKIVPDDWFNSQRAKLADGD